MGIAYGLEQCESGLEECLRALGPDRFVAACVKEGMPQVEAEELAVWLEKR